MYKSILSFFIIVLIAASCKDKTNESTTKIITSNVSLSGLQQIDSNNYFVISQNKIRLLNLNQPHRLSISSTLPFTEITFEAVQGNADTLYIQTKNSIDIYVLTNGSAIGWVKASSISDVLPCDNFLVKSKKMYISKGFSDCNRTAITSELIIYNLKNLATPTVFSKLGIQDPLQLKQNKDFIFLLTKDSSLSRVSLVADSTYETKKLVNVVNATNFEVFNDKLIVNSPKLISQFSIKSGNVLELLSTIPTVE